MGTTNSVAMIYNTEKREPEVCDFKNKKVFASTLALDDQGVEAVGVTQEEALAGKFLGIVSSSKTRMGEKHEYRIGDRKYRPESVASKIMDHGRTVVERYLGVQVKNAIKDRFENELGHFNEAWLKEKIGPEFRAPRTERGCRDHSRLFHSQAEDCCSRCL